MTMNKEQLQKEIKLDIKYGYTPDIPTLRYSGSAGVPIFLWDDLREFSNFKAVVGDEDDINNHYLPEFYKAVTKESYYAWYNMGDSCYEAFMLGHNDWIKDVPVEDYAKTIPQPVTGKIVKVSLQLLTDLDMYYENGKNFSRVKIPVYQSSYTDLVRECYTWVNTPVQLRYFDVKTKQYSLKKGIDLTMMQTVEVNGDKFYEM